MGTLKTKKPGRVRLALSSWLGRTIAPTDSAFWALFGSGGRSAGQNVSQKTVMSLSAAWACTRLLSETVGTLPLQLYERTSSGRRVAAEHPLYRLIHSTPNSFSSASTFWESNVVAVTLRGNGWSERKYFNGRLQALEFLDPCRLVPRKLANGLIEFVYIELDGKRRVIRQQDLFHIPGFSFDGRYGVSAIAYGAGVFGSGLAAAQAANGTFERGLMPTVAFTMDRVLKENQREDFRTNFKKHVSGAMNAGESPLLEGGMKAEAIGIDPSDAQLLESRGFSVEEVCRWFRVDPSLVGHGGKDSNWGTGLEQKLIGFLTFTLRPWLTRIEQAINRQLLSPRDQLRYYAEFSIEGLLRADSKARSAFYSVMVNNGIFTRDEVRRLENMPAMGGNAEVLTVQTSMAPLDSLGQMNDGDTARAALAAWLGSGDQETAEE